MEIKYPDGATPLDLNEIDGLLLPHITTQKELNRWEQQNILKAEEWAFGKKHKDILGQRFVCQLHKKMFGEVWKWAGQFRRTNKNLGVDKGIIAIELANLCADCSAWIEFQTYPNDEIAARFHHRLVQIHPFANGNGRHARLMADVVLKQLLGEEPFTWGQGDLVAQGDKRGQYINALKAADAHDYSELMEFVRS